MEWRDRSRTVLVGLSEDGFIHDGESAIKIGNYDPKLKENYDCIKQMYSDHFLVGFTKPIATQPLVHLIKLVSTSTLETYSTLEFPEMSHDAKRPKFIRLLNPRRHIELALVRQQYSLTLIGRVNRKLVQIWHNENGARSAPCYIGNLEWIMGASHEIITFRIVVPAALF